MTSLRFCESDPPPLETCITLKWCTLSIICVSIARLYDLFPSFSSLLFPPSLFPLTLFTLSLSIYIYLVPFPFVHLTNLCICMYIGRVNGFFVFPSLAATCTLFESVVLCHMMALLCLSCKIPAYSLTPPQPPPLTLPQLLFLIRVVPLIISFLVTKGLMPALFPSCTLPSFVSCIPFSSFIIFFWIAEDRLTHGTHV